MRALAHDPEPAHMFSWLYLTQKKHLGVERDHAYSIYCLAELTRCMPGAIAQVGPSNPGMVRLLSGAVGSGREIFLVDDSGDLLQPVISGPMLSTLPGLPDRSIRQAGVRRFTGGLDQAGREMRSDQRFCFVHLLDADPVSLQRSMAFFLERLSTCGILLLEVPADASATDFSTALRTLLAGRPEKIVPLKTRHCLVINVHTPPPRRLDPQVRIRHQQPLAAAL